MWFDFDLNGNQFYRILSGSAVLMFLKERHLPSGRIRSGPGGIASCSRGSRWFGTARSAVPRPARRTWWRPCGCAWTAGPIPSSCRWRSPAPSSSSPAPLPWPPACRQPITYNVAKNVSFLIFFGIQNDKSTNFNNFCYATCIHLYIYLSIGICISSPSPSPFHPLWFNLSRSLGTSGMSPFWYWLTSVGLLVVTIWLQLSTSYTPSCHHRLHHP